MSRPETRQAEGAGWQRPRSPPSAVRQALRMLPHSLQPPGETPSASQGGRATSSREEGLWEWKRVPEWRRGSRAPPASPTPVPQKGRRPQELSWTGLRGVSGLTSHLIDGETEAQADLLCRAEVRSQTWRHPRRDASWAGGGGGNPGRASRQGERRARCQNFPRKALSSSTPSPVTGAVGHSCSFKA